MLLNWVRKKETQSIGKITLSLSPFSHLRYHVPVYRVSFIITYPPYSFAPHSHPQVQTHGNTTEAGQNEVYVMCAKRRFGDLQGGWDVGIAERAATQVGAWEQNYVMSRVGLSGRYNPPRHDSSVQLSLTACPSQICIDSDSSTPHIESCNISVEIERRSPSNDFPWPSQSTPSHIADILAPSSTHLFPSLMSAQWACSILGPFYLLGSVRSWCLVDARIDMMPF